MTGEMHAIDQETGRDSNGDVWSLHLAVAKALGGKLCPFDVYQGPYIAVGPDIRAGTPPYAVPLNLPGSARLWIQSEDGYFATVYREDTKQQSDPFPMHGMLAEPDAINAARSLF